MQDFEDFKTMQPYNEIQRTFERMMLGALELEEVLEKIDVHYDELYLYTEEFFNKWLELKKIDHEVVEKRDELYKQIKSLESEMKILEKEMALDLKKDFFLKLN